jgi:hypothetical protein
MQPIRVPTSRRHRATLAVTGVILAAVAVALVAWRVGSTDDRAPQSDHAARQAFWDAIGPNGSEVFSAAGFDELAGAAQTWVVATVEGARIAGAPGAYESVLVVQPQQVLGEDVPGSETLAVLLGGLTWTPLPEQVQRLEAGAPVGETYLLGVVDRSPGAGEVRLVSTAAAFRVVDGSLVPVFDRAINAEWLAWERVSKLSTALARIEGARAACVAASSCIIGFDATGAQVLGRWAR